MLYGYLFSIAIGSFLAWALTPAYVNSALDRGRQFAAYAVFFASLSTLYKFQVPQSQGGDVGALILWLIFTLLFGVLGLALGVTTHQILRLTRRLPLKTAPPPKTQSVTTNIFGALMTIALIGGFWAFIYDTKFDPASTSDWFGIGLAIAVVSINFAIGGYSDETQSKPPLSKDT
jgi:hypothetical protein